MKYGNARRVRSEHHELRTFRPVPANAKCKMQIPKCKMQRVTRPPPPPEPQFAICILHLAICTVLSLAPARFASHASGLSAASCFCCVVFASGAATAAEPDDPNKIPTVKIAFSPMAEPSPALKYQLLPPAIVRRPGNAAVHYGKVKAEQNAVFGDGKVMEKIAELSGMPLDEIPHAGGPARNSSPTTCSARPWASWRTTAASGNRSSGHRGASSAIGTCRFASSPSTRSSCLRFKSRGRSHGYWPPGRGCRSSPASTTTRSKRSRWAMPSGGT